MKILSKHLIHLEGYGNYVLNKTPQITVPENDFVDAKVYLQLLLEIFEKTQDPLIGIKFGNYLNLSALESIYEISLAATTLRQAFTLWADYAKVNFPLLEFHVLEKSDSFELLIDSSVDDLQIKELVLDAFVTFVERELYLMLDENIELKIEVPAAELGPYQELYRFVVSKGPSHRFIFRYSLDDVLINQRNNGDLIAVLPTFIEAIHKVELKVNSFTAKVQKVILQLAKPDFPKIEEVAKQLFITERTLQRKLFEEGTNYREICQRIKHKIYGYMTLGNSHKKKEIAYFLGYSGTSALLHAVAQWQNL